MRAMERLRRVYRHDRQPFVAACYRELLAREPDPQGMEHHLRLLTGGTPKAAILTGLLQSEEAARLYRSGPAGSGKKRRSTADILRGVFAGSDERCVRGLYEELLCRGPDYPSFGRHLSHLRRGGARTDVAAGLLRSAEAAELLEASTDMPIARKLLFDFAERTFMPDPLRIGR